jgi:hypothetical protein
MLGAAIAIAVFAVLFVLELLFLPREQQRDPETFWSL